MELVIHTSYGYVDSDFAKRRWDKDFIEKVKRGDVQYSDIFGDPVKLAVVSIPDDATDYWVINYDGSEGVFYCVDGGIYFTGTENCRIFEDSSRYTEREII